MIKQTFRQINFLSFIPGRKKKENGDRPPTVSVSKKFGNIKFPNRTCSMLGLTGNFIALFYEPHRKIIGWRIFTRTNDIRDLKVYKLVKPNQKSGVFSVSIKPMLNEMRGLNSNSYPKLEVKKYVDQTMLNKGDTYYYVQLQEPNESIESEVDSSFQVTT